MVVPGDDVELESWLEWRAAVLVELRGLREDLVGLLAPAVELRPDQRLRFEAAAERALAVRRSEVPDLSDLDAARPPSAGEGPEVLAEHLRVRAAERLAGSRWAAPVSLEDIPTEVLAAEMRVRADKPILTGMPPVPWETVVAWCRSEARITAAEDGPAQDHPAAMERVAAQVAELVAAAVTVAAMAKARLEMEWVTANSEASAVFERLDAALAGGPDVGGVLFVEDLASILADPAVKSEYLLDELRRRGEVEDV